MTEPRIEHASESSRLNDEEFNALLVKELNAFYQSVLSDEWDAHAAEDIMQETLLRAIKKNEQLREPGKLRAWLGTIRRRVGIKVGKDAQREAKHAEPIGYKKMSDLHETLKMGDPAAIAAEREEREKRSKMLKEGYRSLPLPLREVFGRYYWQGKSESEIAEELDISLKTVKRRLKQIEKRLSKYMLRMIVAYMSFELSAIDTQAKAAQIFENVLKIHNAQLAAAATTGSVASQGGAPATVAKSTGMSLVASLLYLGVAFLSLLSLLFGGQLFGEYVVRNAPTLRARRWLVKRYMIWYGILLSTPLIHGGLIIALIHVAKLPYPLFESRILRPELIVLGVLLTAYVSTVSLLYIKQRKFPENDAVDGGFEALRRFVQRGCSIFILLNLMVFGVIGWIISEPNASLLLRPGINPVRFGYLVGTLGIFGLTLACVYFSFVHCFHRLMILANDTSSLPQRDEPVSNAGPGTWRTETFFVVPFAAFPLLANTNHIFYRQTNIVYFAVELLVFTIWWYIVLRMNVANTTFRWPRIIVSTMIQLFIMWSFRCLLGS